MRNTIIGLFFRSFLKGLIILAPIGITAYVIWLVFDKVDTLIPMFPRGVGFVIVISSVTVVGYFGTRFFIGKALFDFFDHLLERTPGIKFIYSTVKDIMSSFVGDKKRFTKPVWVRTHNTPDTWRIGFLTQELERGAAGGAFIGFVGGQVTIFPLKQMPEMIDAANRRPSEQWWLELRPIVHAMAQHPANQEASR